MDTGCNHNRIHNHHFLPFLIFIITLTTTTSAETSLSSNSTSTSPEEANPQEPLLPQLQAPQQEEQNQPEGQRHLNNMIDEYVGHIGEINSWGNVLVLKPNSTLFINSSQYNNTRPIFYITSPVPVEGFGTIFDYSAYGVHTELNSQTRSTPEATNSAPDYEMTNDQEPLNHTEPTPEATLARDYELINGQEPYDQTEPKTNPKRTPDEATSAPDSESVDDHETWDYLWWSVMIVQIVILVIRFVLLLRELLRD